MSKKQVVVTAAAAIGLAALIAIILAIKTGGGTPIIIKGSSLPNQYLTLTFDVPPTGAATTLKVAGGFDTAKVIGTNTKGVTDCVIFDYTGFGCWSNLIQLTTESVNADKRIDLDDTLFDGIEATFDTGDFDGKPPTAPKEFKSKNYVLVKSLMFDAKSVKPTCRDKTGPINCPQTWDYLEGLEIWINANNPTCQ